MSTESVPIVLVPGLLASARLYASQIPQLWRLGPVLIADHTRHDSMAKIAAAILASAPARFALIGLSMGGYVALEIMRQGPERVARLGLLDTSARPDAPQQTKKRLLQIELTRGGRFHEISDMQFPLMVSRARQDDDSLRQLTRLMAEEIGPDAFVRQQTAVMQRPDSRPHLAAIRCPTLVLVGAQDMLTPLKLAREMVEGIAGARLASVPECGHLSTLEQPDAVSRILLEWLGSD